MVLADGMLIAVADVGDVIPTEPMFCLLSDEDVLFFLAFIQFLDKLRAYTSRTYFRAYFRTHF